MAGQQTAPVLGATGGIGGEIARAAIARGWKVQALNRNPANIVKPVAGTEWVCGDAMDRAKVIAAAERTD